MRALTVAVATAAVATSTGRPDSARLELAAGRAGESVTQTDRLAGETEYGC